MDHLSSCYFCGTALDEQLQEYAVVPPAFRDAERDVTTATLCPTCQQKLERVLDAVVAAAEGAESVSSDATSGGDAGTDEAEPAGDADEGTAGAGARDVLVDPDEAIDSPDEDDITAADVTAMAGDVDADVLEDEEADADEELQDAMNPDVPEEFRSGGETADESVEETAGDDEVADEAPDDEADPLADSGTGAGGGDASRSDGVKSADETEADDGTDAGQSAADDAGADGQVAGEDADVDAPASDEGAADATPSAQASISALEYNKVMRLLQNREFPVDRAEIETVAANAYDLSRSECAAVIDLAVDRGLIAETDGQLARPE
ncbi:MULTISPECIES: hypothetical protein [Salinibaculum]|uniref:hypothetical protein n=1 Tax=Salinibaculum TaxID=2732368 RepID=UPI0030D5F01B